MLCLVILCTDILTNARGSIGIVEITYTALLALSAFWLGACPFALWIGQWLLRKDIRNYGDGNPGATNVFRIGSRKVGILALILDIGKGMPFVALAYLLFGLPDVAVMIVGLCAILGHAFSPLLNFDGGKALAVTGGVLIAMPQHEIIISVLIFMLLAFLFVASDGWRPIIGMAGSLAYLLITRGYSWEPLLMLCVIIILAIKHYDELRTAPRFKILFTGRMRSKKLKA